MNMFLHSFDSARIEWCDTLNSPLLVENDRLMRFNCVVANPPFSLDKWGAENADSDQFNRFWRGIYQPRATPHKHSNKNVIIIIFSINNFIVLELLILSIPEFSEMPKTNSPLEGG